VTVKMQLTVHSRDSYADEVLH